MVLRYFCSFAEVEDGCQVALGRYHLVPRGAFNHRSRLACIFHRWSWGWSIFRMTGDGFLLTKCTPSRASSCSSPKVWGCVHFRIRFCR